MTLSNPSADDDQETVLYALFLSIKPGKELTPTVIDQHTAHLADLDRQGKLVLAGPLLARFSGLTVLRVPSLAQARAIAEEDPMIRGRLQTYELVTWVMANKQNHYRPTVGPARKQ